MSEHRRKPRAPRVVKDDPWSFPFFDQSVIPEFDFDLQELNKRCWLQATQGKTKPSQVMICPSTSLAYVKAGDDFPCAQICIHPLLNAPWTPMYVIEAILIHENIHLAIRPREIQGELKHHPPEFWECERALNPFIRQMWFWLQARWPLCYHKDDQAERTWVLKRWRRERARLTKEFELSCRRVGYSNAKQLLGHPEILFEYFQPVRALHAELEMLPSRQSA